MSFDVGYEGSSGRDSTGLGNAWGTRGGSLIRRIFNAVVPVTVVERHYGDLDGSLSSLTAGTPGALGFRPAVEFFSASRDWELHAVNVFYPLMFDAGLTGGSTNYRMLVHIFTAFAGYNPVEFNPTIIFGPVLVTNPSFNQGTVRGQGGVNPVNNPLGQGWTLSDNVHRVGTQGTGPVLASVLNDSALREYITGPDLRNAAWDKKLVQSITFRRPLRILRNRRLTIALHAQDPIFSYNPIHNLVASILYTELPNPRQSYRT